MLKGRRANAVDNAGEAVFACIEGLSGSRFDIRNDRADRDPHSKPAL